MPVKRTYVIGILNDNAISEVNDVISKYAINTHDTSSHMYFLKHPIDLTLVTHDVIFFQIVAENDSELDAYLKNAINDLDALNVEYVLRDYDTGEFLVTVRYGGQIEVSFDNVKVLKKGTFERIDELKLLSTDVGYCRGFKPSFRPLEGKSIEDKKVLPEIIYLISDSKENLLRLRDNIIQRVLEIDSNLECEFTLFFK